MKMSRLLSAAVVTVLGFMLATASPVVSAQQYKKIKRLGTSQSICSGGVETAAELQEFFANNPNRIRTILADSGWTGSADDLLAAVAAGEMTERAYPVGTKMAWMGARVDGQDVANPYREWAGAKSFEAFQVNVSSGCQIYHIAIPKACCNVSLISVAADESAECLAPVGEVAPVAAPVVADTSSTKAKKALGLIPFIGAFAGSETRARFEPSWSMDVVDSSGITGLRAGLLKEINAKTSVFGQLSYVDRNSINEGNVYPEDNLAFDIGIERKLGRGAFIGGGIGAWNIDDSDFRDTSIFGHVGGGFGNSNLQWFLEGRVFDSDSETNDSISDNKMFSAGLRYLIK